jgi:Tfp pilus assembly protein PilX
MVRVVVAAGAKSNYPVTLPPVPANVTWAKNDPATAQYGSAWSPTKTISNVSNQPRYLMELFCAPMFYEEASVPAACRLYRLTATGWGRNPNTRVTLQETFLKDKLK